MVGDKLEFERRRLALFNAFSASVQNDSNTYLNDNKEHEGQNVINQSIPLKPDTYAVEVESGSHRGERMGRGYISKAKSINWGTPPEIKDRFEGWFDPCPHPRPEWCGLSIPWPKKVFVNPPFNRLDLWVEKCAVEYMAGSEITLLMPARVDTKYFHAWVLPYAQIEFIKGRVRYVDLDGSSELPQAAPFPSILCHYKHPTEPMG